MKLPGLLAIPIVIAGLVISSGSLVPPLHAGQSPGEGGSIDPSGDPDNDGLSNEEETEYGTKPNAGGADTDGDGLNDGLDGWAREPKLKFPRVPEAQYAEIDMSGLLGAEAKIRGLDDSGNIVYSKNDAVFIWKAASGSSTAGSFGMGALSRNGYISGTLLPSSSSLNKPVIWNIDTLTPQYLSFDDPDYLAAPETKNWQATAAHTNGSRTAIEMAWNSREEPVPGGDEHTLDSGGIVLIPTTSEVRAGVVDDGTLIPGKNQTTAGSFCGVTNSGIFFGKLLNEGYQFDYSVILENSGTAQTVYGQVNDMSDVAAGPQPTPAPQPIGVGASKFLVSGDTPVGAFFYKEGSVWTPLALSVYDRNFGINRDGGTGYQVTSNAMVLSSNRLLRNGKSRRLFPNSQKSFSSVSYLNNKGIIAANVYDPSSEIDKPEMLVPYKFTELNPESGFDKYTEPNWLMVPKDQQNWTKAITPANAGMEIKFKVVPGPGGATVTPDSTHQSPETLTVSSPTLGDTTSVVIGIGTAFGTEGLKLSVKKYKPMTVTLHVVTQQDGGGAPDALCIGPGANGVIDTSPGGDDTVGGGGIRTGADGLCDTTAQGDDVQILRKPIKVAQPPSQSDVQQMLTKVFGLQVNTYFTVSIDQKVVDYDLDRDGLLDINVAAAPSDEQNVLEGHVKSVTDFNLYYVHNFVTHGVAGNYQGWTIKDLKCAYIKDGASEVYRNHTAAHEIGHIFGLNHPSVNRDIHFGPEPPHENDKNRLMNGEYNPENLKPSLLLKFEWDVINPNP